MYPSFANIDTYFLSSRYTILPIPNRACFCWLGRPILGSGLMCEGLGRKREVRGVHNKKTQDGAEEQSKISANPLFQRKPKNIILGFRHGMKKEERVDTGMDLILESITKKKPSPFTAKLADI